MESAPRNRRSSTNFPGLCSFTSGASAGFAGRQAGSASIGRSRFDDTISTLPNRSKSASASFAGNGIHRRVLQSAALAFCAGLLLAGRIRAQGRRPGRKSRRNDRGFCEQRQRRKDFERASGERDSNAVPFPRPLLLLEDARTLLQKRKLRPKNLCHERGSPQGFRSNFSPLQGVGCTACIRVGDTRCGT